MYLSYRPPEIQLACLEIFMAALAWPAATSSQDCLSHVQHIESWRTCSSFRFAVLRRLRLPKSGLLTHAVSVANDLTFFGLHSVDCCAFSPRCFSTAIRSSRSGARRLRTTHPRALTRRVPIEGDKLGHLPGHSWEHECCTDSGCLLTVYRRTHGVMRSREMVESSRGGA